MGEQAGRSLGSHPEVIRGTGPTHATARRHPPGTPSPLAAALGARLTDRPPASVVGLEHEYSLSVTGERLDFRALIHDLAIPGRRLDPGDLNAYRCASGLAITCDAEDAEVVSPPLPVQPGFAIEVAAWAEHGRAELLRLLPAGVTVTPFSTHISASMPDDLVDAACELFARTFAPALILVLGGADSHGVFVRPRPGRLEVCGEHAMGGRLAAAATLVAGGARACAAALLGGKGEAGHLPPVLAVDLRPARGRHGLFVGRNLAFGYDLHLAGRDGVVPLQVGGVIPAQEYLLLAWAAAGAGLGADASDADVQAGDAIVSGSLPVGAEEAGVDSVSRPWPVPGARSPFGDVLVPRRRPAFDVVADAATWDFTVFRLRSSARRAYACVPGSQLGRFLDRLDAGSLDGLLGGFLDGTPTGRVLVAHDDTAEAGLWDDAAIGPDLLAYERTDLDGDQAGPVVSRLPPVGVAEQAAPAYVRRGKGTVFATSPIASMHSPLCAGSPAVDASDPPLVPAGVPTIPTDVPAAPLEAPPAAEPPRPPPVRPAERPGRRRRRAGVLVGSLLVLVLAAGAAAATVLFASREPAGVSILTSPTSPSPSSDLTVAPPTASLVTATSTPALDTTTVPTVDPTITPTGPGPVVGTVPAVPRPTTAVTVPSPTVITVPSSVILPVETSVPTTTTTSVAAVVTAPPPTSLLVAVTSGILGCGFQPSSASLVPGSTVRFRNDTATGISISVARPAGANTIVSLEAAGTSSGYVLTTAGSYAITCTTGGDALVGRMTVTVVSP